MEAIGIVILIAVALFCAWVLTMVRLFAKAAKDDDVEEEEGPPTDEKVEWIKKEAHRWALGFVTEHHNIVSSTYTRLACNDDEWALFKQYYEERKRELTIIAEGKTLWLLTGTASYGTEVTVTRIAKIANGGYSILCTDKRGRRYWVKPEQLSPFSPRELYGKYQFDAIVYWPETPYHGRKVAIREYDEDYLYTECGLMLTHAMIRFPRHKFPIMRIEDETESGISTIEK